MPTITYDEFDVGLDHRKGKSVSDANRLRELKNAYVTKGKVIRKRPGVSLVADFAAVGEAGSVGLVAGLGKLNTFREDPVVVHSNSLFQNHELTHPSGPLDIEYIDFGDVFAGYIYVSCWYSNGSRLHHWLDGTVPPRILDVMCPQTESFVITSSKIYCINGPDVHVSKLLDARVWTQTSGNGALLAVSSNSVGSSVSKAVSEYDGRLGVYFNDSVQFYNTDEAWDADVYYKSVNGIGTKYPQTIKEFAGDTVFLSNSGFRSITTLANTNENLAETDVGSPIDDLVKPQLTGLNRPFAEFYTAGGQYWCCMREVTPQQVWAYTFSRTQKISAWARYFFDFQIDDMAVNEGTLYLRSGEKVYSVDQNDTVWTDDGVDYEMVMEMPFLDFKKPGSTKYISAMDIVLTGSIDVQFRYDPNDNTKITEKIRLTGDTRPLQSIPVEITTAGIAPVFSITNDEDVQIDAITFYYEELGNV